LKIININIQFNHSVEYGTFFMVLSPHDNNIVYFIINGGDLKFQPDKLSEGITTWDNLPQAKGKMIKYMINERLPLQSDLTSFGKDTLCQIGSELLHFK
jgi:hypothetical protein